jgi:hypothetical protein
MVAGFKLVIDFREFTTKVRGFQPSSNRPGETPVPSVLSGTVPTLGPSPFVSPTFRSGSESVRPDSEAEQLERYSALLC